MDSAVTSVFLGSDCVGQLVDGRFPLLRWLSGSERSSVFLTELAGQPPRKAAIRLIAANAVHADALLSQWAAAASLSHPRLMRLLQSGRCEVAGEDCLYAVTEYADEVLSEILAQRPLTPDETAEMLDPVLDALSWLHARGLVHGRIRPSNILVVDDHLKLSVDAVHPMGESGELPPSPGPSDAPETAAGRVFPASDVWSLGALVVEAMTQRPPAWNSSQGAEPALPGSIQEPFSTLVRGCLQIDPARRPTLSGVRAFLQPAPAAPEPSRAAQRPVVENTAPEDEGMVSPGPARETAARSSRTRALILTGAVVVLGGVIATVAIGSRHHQDAAPATAQVPAAQAPESQAPEAQGPATGTPAPQASAPAAEQPQPSAPEPATPEASTSKSTGTAAAPPVASQPQPSAGGSSVPESGNPPSSAAPPPAVESPAAPASGAVIKGAAASQPVPDVPRHILDTVHGHVRVRIRVEVDPEGKVSDASIDDAGPSHYFAEKALATARTWTFTPAQVNGQPAASTWMLHFSFGESGTTVTPAETAP
jgi:TonB family protein